MPKWYGNIQIMLTLAFLSWESGTWAYSPVESDMAKSNKSPWDQVSTELSWPSVFHTCYYSLFMEELSISEVT